MLIMYLFFSYIFVTKGLTKVCLYLTNVLKLDLPGNGQAYTVKKPEKASSFEMSIFAFQYHVDRTVIGKYSTIPTSQKVKLCTLAKDLAVKYGRSEN